MRLERPKGKAKVIQTYKMKAASSTKLIMQAAAKTWINGVPWAEAWKIAERMASRLPGQGKGRGKGAGGRGRGKGG